MHYDHTFQHTKACKKASLKLSTFSYILGVINRYCSRLDLDCLCFDVFINQIQNPWNMGERWHTKIACIQSMIYNEQTWPQRKLYQWYHPPLRERSELPVHSGHRIVTQPMTPPSLGQVKVIFSRPKTRANPLERKRQFSVELNPGGLYEFHDTFHEKIISVLWRITLVWKLRGILI